MTPSGDENQIVSNNGEQSGAISDAVSLCLDVDTNQDFKSLICPLCFKFIYKCQTTVCGHSFCTKCIDEYLIIKKVSMLRMSFHKNFV